MTMQIEACSSPRFAFRLQPAGRKTIEAMVRHIAVAAVLALGAGAAQARDQGPRLIGGGEDAAVVYDQPSRDQPSRNVVGGGIASLEGGDEDRRVTYGAVTTQPRSGMVARLSGGGDEQQIVYLPAPASTVTIANQTARPGG